jgi:hypothetical protein
MFDAKDLVKLPEREFPYNKNGDSIYVSKSGPGFVNFATKGKNEKPSAYWLIEKLSATRYLSQIKIYNSKEPDVISRPLTLGQLVTLADMRRDLDESHKRFAKRIGADVAWEGRFARRRNRVAIPNPGTGEDGDAVFYFLTKPAVKNALRKLILGPALVGRPGGREAKKYKPGMIL